MPTSSPPHKETFFKATDADRLEMCRLAFGDINGAEVSDFEINAGGKSYSYVTLDYLKKQYPDYKILFLMGTDMLASFDKWKYPEKYSRLPRRCFAKERATGKRRR